MTIDDVVKGSMPVTEIEKPIRVQPAQSEWWNVDSSIALTTFGYPDNFDNSYPFTLYFYIDDEVKKILKAGLTLQFQKFRTYTKPLAHTHTVTVGNHTHTVTIAAHTHTINSATTDDEGTGTSAHQHTVLVTGTSTTVANAEAAGYKVLMVNPANGPTMGDCGDGGNAGSVFASNTTASHYDLDFKTNCTINGHNHDINSTSTASGGASTPTSSSGGASTPTSSETAGAEYGVFEDTYPADVDILLDGVDITTNLGGPFNPTAGTNLFKNLDLTPFITEGGLHTLQLTTTGRGRCLPLLFIKSIISR